MAGFTSVQTPTGFALPYEPAEVQGELAAALSHTSEMAAAAYAEVHGTVHPASTAHEEYHGQTTDNWLAVQDALNRPNPAGHITTVSGTGGIAVTSEQPAPDTTNYVVSLGVNPLNNYPICAYADNVDARTLLVFTNVSRSVTGIDVYLETATASTATSTSCFQVVVAGTGGPSLTLPLDVPGQQEYHSSTGSSAVLGTAGGSAIATGSTMEGGMAIAFTTTAVVNLAALTVLPSSAAYSGDFAVGVVEVPSGGVTALSLANGYQSLPWVTNASGQYAYALVGSPGSYQIVELAGGFTLATATTYAIVVVALANTSMGTVEGNGSPFGPWNGTSNLYVWLAYDSTSMSTPAYSSALPAWDIYGYVAAVTMTGNITISLQAVGTPAAGASGAGANVAVSTVNN